MVEEDVFEPMCEDDSKQELMVAGLPISFVSGKRDLHLEKRTTDKIEVLHNPHPKRKKKKMPPNLAKHSVYTEEWQVPKLLEEHPNGLNYMKSTDVSPEINTTPPNSVIITPKNNTSNNLQKYYRQRYDFFHLFDEGIQIDEEGWFSVTPERIAHHTAQAIFDRHGQGIIWDAFGGVGGNAIQFAKAGMHVIATELSECRLEIARHNATIYQVDWYIDFILGDAYQFPNFWRLHPSSKSGNKRRNGRKMRKRQLKKVNYLMSPFCSVFLSPPWGGPSYLNADTYDPQTMLPVDFKLLARIAHSLSNDLIFYLPRNTDVTKVARLLPKYTDLLVECHFLADRPKVLILHSTNTLLLPKNMSKATDDKSA